MKVVIPKYFTLFLRPNPSKVNLCKFWGREGYTFNPPSYSLIAVASVTIILYICGKDNFI